MKKIFSLFLVLMLISSLFIGCAKTAEPVETAPAETTETESTETEAATTEATEATAPAETGAYVDGIYFAADDQFAAESGWKEVITIEVKDGKITTVDWNGAHVNAGKDKKTVSKDGDYGMVAYGKAIAEWDVQAAAAEAYLIENQNLDAINLTDAEGHTDSIAGVTINVSNFQTLVNKAIAAGPVGSGKYVDGSYFAEATKFSDSGWKDNVSITVINGNIVAANWNGTHKDGGKDKKTASIDGDYGMVKFGKAISEWHEQAILIENFFIEGQDIDQITLTDAAHTDAVAGVTIGVSDFVTLAKSVLKMR